MVVLHCVLWDTCESRCTARTFSYTLYTKMVLLHWVLWDACEGQHTVWTFSYTLHENCRSPFVLTDAWRSECSVNVLFLCMKMVVLHCILKDACLDESTEQIVSYTLHTIELHVKVRALSKQFLTHFAQKWWFSTMYCGMCVWIIVWGDLFKHTLHENGRSLTVQS
jgi:hypothetical protein